MIGVVRLNFKYFFFHHMVLGVDEDKLVETAIIFLITVSRLLRYMLKLGSLVTLRFWIRLQRVRISIFLRLFLL